jgi:hypothetical protein
VPRKLNLAIAEQVFVRIIASPIAVERGRGCESGTSRHATGHDAGIAVWLGHASAFVARVTEQLAGSSRLGLYWRPADPRRQASPSGRSRPAKSSVGRRERAGALKLARRYQAVVAEAPHRTTIVSTHGSFHGRSIATVSITGQPKYREHFGPLFGPVEFIPYGDLDAAAKQLEGRNACAIIVEPIQAEGGIIVAPPGYLAGLRQLCTETGTILIFDEVQTGVGRTGKWFGYEHDDVEPDVMTLAKGLGGGVPIGAVACSDKAALGLAATTGGAVPHASTFGGNALACAANAVFDIIEPGVDRARGAAGSTSRASLQVRDEFPKHATEIRGRGSSRTRVSAPAWSSHGRERLLLSVAGDKIAVRAGVCCRDRITGPAIFAASLPTDWKAVMPRGFLTS